jgi:tRNA threonylcarbamoyladenosine biosynthesis protein TsaB
MFDVGSTWLFLDASGVAVRAGVWQNMRWLGWQESEAPALEAIFAQVRGVLTEARLPLEKIDGYLYVEGPGSVLGLRLAAMAIRAWQIDEAARNGGKAKPVLACGSLPLAATLALAAKTPPPFAVFTEARQGHWHVLDVNDGENPPDGAATPREVEENGLPAGTLFHLPARKAWHQPPPQAHLMPFSLRDHPEILSRPNLFRPVETPTPYASHPPEYKKWAGAKT